MYCSAGFVGEVVAVVGVGEVSEGLSGVFVKADVCMNVVCVTSYGKSFPSKVHSMLAVMLTFLARHVAFILSLSLSLSAGAGQLPMFGPETISIDGNAALIAGRRPDDDFAPAEIDGVI